VAATCREILDRRNPKNRGRRLPEKDPVQENKMLKLDAIHKQRLLKAARRKARKEFCCELIKKGLDEATTKQKQARGDVITQLAKNTNFVMIFGC